MARKTRKSTKKPRKGVKTHGPPPRTGRGVARMENEPRWDVADFNELYVPELLQELDDCRVEVPEKEKKRPRKGELVHRLNEHYNQNQYRMPLRNYLRKNSKGLIPADTGLALRRAVQELGAIFGKAELEAALADWNRANNLNSCEGWYELIETLFDKSQKHCKDWKNQKLLIGNNPAAWGNSPLQNRVPRSTLELMWTAYKGPLTGLMGPNRGLGPDRSRVFRQTDVRGDGACLWRAFAQAYWGDERLWKRVKFDVGVLLNYGTRESDNRISYARNDLYDHLIQDSRDDFNPEHGDLLTQVFGSDYGTDHALQLLADAYGVQIFAHFPNHEPDGTKTWGLVIRGQNRPPRGQIHMLNYRRFVHWTALTPQDLDDQGAGTTDDYDEGNSMIVGFGSHGAVENLDRVDPGHQDRVTIALRAPQAITSTLRTADASEANYQLGEDSSDPLSSSFGSSNSSSNQPSSSGPANTSSTLKQGQKRPRDNEEEEYDEEDDEDDEAEDEEEGGEEEDDDEDQDEDEKDENGSERDASAGTPSPPKKRKLTVDAPRPYSRSEVLDLARSFAESVPKR